MLLAGEDFPRELKFRGLRDDFTPLNLFFRFCIHTLHLFITISNDSGVINSGAISYNMYIRLANHQRNKKIMNFHFLMFVASVILDRGGI